MDSITDRNLGGGGGQGANNNRVLHNFQFQYPTRTTADNMNRRTRAAGGFFSLANEDSGAVLRLFRK
jgi:hypothetical protein